MTDKKQTPDIGELKKKLTGATDRATDDVKERAKMAGQPGDQNKPDDPGADQAGAGQPGDENEPDDNAADYSEVVQVIEEAIVLATQSIEPGVSDADAGFNQLERTLANKAWGVLENRFLARIANSPYAAVWGFVLVVGGRRIKVINKVQKLKTNTLRNQFNKQQNEQSKANNTETGKSLAADRGGQSGNGEKHGS